MVQSELKFRSLINLNMPEIKRIGQELLTSKPWSPPQGPNKTRYQGTPPKKQSNSPKGTPKPVQSFESLTKELSEFLSSLSL